MFEASLSLCYVVSCFSFLYIVVVRRDVDAAMLSAGVKGRLRARGDKLLKQVAAEAKAAAAAAAQSGVRGVSICCKPCTTLFLRRFPQTMSARGFSAGAAVAVLRRVPAPTISSRLVSVSFFFFNVFRPHFCSGGKVDAAVEAAKEAAQQGESSLVMEVSGRTLLNIMLCGC